MIKYIVKYASYLGITLSAIIFGGFVIDKFTVYDDVTELGTLIFFNYEKVLDPNFYSFVQLLSTLPLVSILLITISILGLYVRVNREQIRSRKSLDKFMTLQSRKAQIELLDLQHNAKNNLFYSASDKTFFANETNILINEFNVFNKQKLDITDLTPEEQIEIKNQVLNQYLNLKNFFETIQDNVKIKETIKLISDVTTEINKLSKLV